MPPVSGIFVLAPLAGEAAERVREIQRQYDPKLAASSPPHVTLVGSSGVGPIAVSTPMATLRAVLESIARETPAMTLQFDPPMRFMQTEIVVLPLHPHGPIRDLHEKIRASGLSFGRARFTFTPHSTLSFYPTLTAKRVRELLSIRVDEPVRIERLEVHLTRGAQASRLLFELPLSGD
jgi:2'-5' RNA ligase